jgi:hypothetical protein
MLEQCIDIDHSVKHLHKYVTEYLEAIEKLPKGEKFDLKYCNKLWRTVVGAPSAAGAKKKNLRDLIEAFHISFLALDDKHRTEFVEIFNRTNDITWLFKNPASSIRVTEYPESIREITSSLFIHLYEDTLVKYNVKNHYMRIFKKMKNSWCPFCGMEKFNNFKRFKQDYDHLLAKSKYPVAAVNMLNLVPMGISCNRIHKKTKDILAKDDGSHRKAPNPYTEKIEPHISLTGSILASEPYLRKWQVSITPDLEEIHTWSDLFNIKGRCLEDFLAKENDSTQQSEFDSYVQMFITMSKERKTIEGTGSWNMSRLITELTLFRNGFKTNYYQEFNYLKYASFDFILTDPNASDFRDSLLKNIND